MQSADEDSYDQTLGMPEQPGTRHFLSIGEVVDGAYKVLEFIGAGAFGEVYLVRHDILQRNFALKLLRSSGMDDAVRSRFVQEVQVMAKLEHPNIVKIYNSGVYKGDFPYYIMDLIVGKSLADLIAAGGRIDALSAVTIFTAVADALKVSHGRNIVHRDIKPANIIIADGDGPLDSRVRVVDFGVAKLLGRNSPGYQALTTVGQVFGSPLYMSPEQCNAANIDNRSDVYSLGCALYETLTGVVPFKGPTVMDTFQMHCSQAVPTLKQKSTVARVCS
ncbi:MAG: serine/threonine protein kinase [Candidatus Obscuribacter sp.]|nr:serine/threonine protein kinase [Candidatus Obscuribacter sp.]